MPAIQGLNKEEVGKRLAQTGPNIIFKPHKVKFFDIFKEEVAEPMILLLICVGVIYSFWGKLEDAVTIFIVIFLLVLAEVWNEYRAKKAISALAEIAAPKTKVLRAGKAVEVDSQSIVPGDILILSSGTKVSADAKIAEGIDVEVDESALTGETYAQEKKKGEAIFAGTVVVAGEGLAEVVVTGAQTRLGGIAATAAYIKPPKTPLQLQMKKLSVQLVFVALFFSLGIPLLGWLRGQDLRLMVLTGLSLAFAVIPEELPIVITMVLGLGSYKLSKNNFLIKKIKAAETLGGATVIVTDKTGTITEGKLALKEIIRNGVSPDVLACARLATTPWSLNQLDKLIRGENMAADVSGTGIMRQRNFTNEEKSNAVIRQEHGKYTVYVKGAPEIVFGKCKQADERIKKSLEQQAQAGRRIIAVAWREISSGQLDDPWKSLETDMQLAGLLSFEDPPRAGVKETIAKAAGAGVRTIMVTGDHPATALYIAREVGIADGGTVFSGQDLDKMSDSQLREAVEKASVFARTSPEHKYRLVQALQQNGEVVAVTGDGINDALALKGADIGIAMGLRGTDVAKEAAAVILADDNYITIAQGIFEGRIFYDNLKKGIKYYLAVKIALVCIFLLPVLIGIPMPFSPIQIILLELFMDLAASAGFVSEPAERNIYTRRPRRLGEMIIDKPALLDITMKGLILFISVTAMYFYARSLGWTLGTAQTLAFSTWIFGHIALAYVSRSDRESLYRLGLFSNRVINIWAAAAVLTLIAGVYWPFIGHQFGLAAIDWRFFVGAAAIACILPAIKELSKLFAKNHSQDDRF